MSTRERVRERVDAPLTQRVVIAGTTFTVLDLFIAVAVSAMESQVRRDRDDDGETVRALLTEVRELRTAPADS
ncbi:hypothetical protein AB0I53_13820 [Saccharopolyspora sp. NPDC050389]|uniref:hypothetical protein n=1 Tax=Saccharopolyspora sp. NPDC050389 TaxID=3155516 RepID=UPI0033EBB033